VFNSARFFFVYGKSCFQPDGEIKLCGELENSLIITIFFKKKKKKNSATNKFCFFPFFEIMTFMPSRHDLNVNSFSISTRA
jgi:hypothetical protein